MQYAQGRPPRAGFSAHPLPPGPPDARGTRRTPPRLERSRRRQAPPCAVVAGLFVPRLSLLPFFLFVFFLSSPSHIPPPPPTPRPHPPPRNAEGRRARS